MMIGMQLDMKRLLDIRRFAADIQQHPVTVRVSHGQPVHFRKIDDHPIILLRGAELGRELRRGQIFMIVRAGRIIDLRSKLVSAS